MLKSEWTAKGFIGEPVTAKSNWWIFQCHHWLQHVALIG